MRLTVRAESYGHWIWRERRGSQICRLLHYHVSPGPELRRRGLISPWNIRRTIGGLIGAGCLPSCSIPLCDLAVHFCANTTCDQPVPDADKRLVLHIHRASISYFTARAGDVARGPTPAEERSKRPDDNE